jgi:hypothetical protein
VTNALIDHKREFFCTCCHQSENLLFILNIVDKQFHIEKFYYYAAVWHIACLFVQVALFEADMAEMEDPASKFQFPKVDAVFDMTNYE